MGRDKRREGATKIGRGVSKVVMIRSSAYDVALDSLSTSSWKCAVLFPFFTSSHARKIGTNLIHSSRVDDDPKAMKEGAIYPLGVMKREEREWIRSNKWFILIHLIFTYSLSFLHLFFISTPPNDIHHVIMISHHPMMKIQWLQFMVPSIWSISSSKCWSNGQKWMIYQI